MMHRTESLMPVIVAVLVLPVLCGMGEVREHREELRTLKEQSEDEAAKEKELSQQDANYHKALSAIESGRLKAGMTARDMLKTLGHPAVTTTIQSGEEWLYLARSRKLLGGPRVALFFDRQGKLERWESAGKS